MEYCHKLVPETKAFLGVASFLFALTAVMIPLRLYTRLRIAKPFAWDDASILIAYAISVASCGVGWHLVNLGMGRPLVCLTPTTAVALRKYIQIDECLCLLSMTFSRLSVVLFVIRLFGINKHLKRFLYVWTTYMVIQQTLSSLLPFSYCSPVEGIWNPKVAKTAHCWPMEAIAGFRLFNGVTGILSDLILALLPVYFLCKMQMPMHKRIALVGLMALGLIPAGCAIGRIIMLEKSMKSNDPLIAVTLFIFGALEMYMLMICATMPTLVPFYHKLRSRGKALDPVKQVKTAWTEEKARSPIAPKHYTFVQLTEVPTAA